MSMEVFIEVGEPRPYYHVLQVLMKRACMKCHETVTLYANF